MLSTHRRMTDDSAQFTFVCPISSIQCDDILTAVIAFTICRHFDPCSRLDRRWLRVWAWGISLWSYTQVLLLMIDVYQTLSTRDRPASHLATDYVCLSIAHLNVKTWNKFSHHLKEWVGHVNGNSTLHAEASIMGRRANNFIWVGGPSI